MEITEVRVKLAPPDMPGRSAKLKAFATVTFDNSFVVRDIKVILGARGLFCAMPSRRLTARCPRCRAKNHLHARYCNECGSRFSGRSQKTPELDHRGRAKIHADVAHPINRSCRSLIQKAIVEAYREELDRSKQEGYEPPPYETDDEFAEDALPEDIAAQLGVEDEGIAEPAGDVDEAAGPTSGEPSEGPSEPSGDESDGGSGSDDEGPAADGDLGIFG